MTWDKKSNLSYRGHLVNSSLRLYVEKKSEMCGGVDCRGEVVVAGGWGRLGPREWGLGQGGGDGGLVAGGGGEVVGRGAGGRETGGR